MTHAELLRSHADTALREGGMYYSGEYLSRIASTAESLERENSKLRELVRDWRDLAVGGADSLTDWNHNQADLEQRMRELGVEVGE